MHIFLADTPGFVFCLYLKDSRASNMGWWLSAFVAGCCINCICMAECLWRKLAYCLCSWHIRHFIKHNQPKQLTVSVSPAWPFVSGHISHFSQLASRFSILCFLFWNCISDNDKLLTLGPPCLLPSVATLAIFRWYLLCFNYQMRDIDTYFTLSLVLSSCI